LKKKLPEFVRAVKFGDGSEAMIFAQDAFAADYQEEEYRLLGMAIKYAGLHGRETMISLDSK